MIKIKFYDLRYRQLKIAPNGELIDLESLINKTYKKDPETFEKNKDQISLATDIEKIDPLQYKGKQWKKLFNTVVYAISGHIPTKDETRNVVSTVYKLRSDLIRKIPDIRNIIDTHSFMFGVLPYLFSGFAFNGGSINKNGHNPVESVVDTLEKLISTNSISISTMLCAHRESKEIDQGALVSQLDFSSIDKMVNLVAGVVSNMPGNESRKCYWTIYQPCGSVYGVGSIFPNVILRYLRTGEIYKLLFELDAQFKEIKDYLRTFDYVSNIVFKVETTDQIMDSAIRAMDSTLQKIKHPKEIFHKIKQISEGDTSKDMARIAPYFLKVKDAAFVTFELNLSNMDGSKYATIENLRNRTVATIEKMKLGQNLQTKSLQETWFYYVWGFTAFESNSIILGFERDHDLFQTKAISLAYNAYTKMNRTKFSGPFLFAKRHRPFPDTGNLSNLSFRQFWRLSENSNESGEI